MTLHANIAAARSVGLTRSQRRYLDAVAALTADGLPTTHRAVATACGVNVGAVYQQLLRLRRDGYVALELGQIRTIRLTTLGADTVRDRAGVDAAER